MPRQIVEIAVAAVIFVASGFGIRQALTFTGAAAYMPVVVLGFAMILCCIWAAQSLISLRRERIDIVVKIDEFRRLIIIAALSLVYVLMIPVLGFFSATVLFIPITAFWLGLRNLKVIALATVGFTGLLYVTFNMVLNTPLPPELIGQLAGIIP